MYQTLPAEKMKICLSKIFFRFSLAVIAIENDDEGRKQNFSISPMGGVMVYQTLPAEKNDFFFKDFFRFSLTVMAIENDDEGRKQNFFYLTYGWSYGVTNPPSSQQKKKNCQRFLFHSDKNSGCYGYFQFP